MALLFHDGFDFTSSSAVTIGKWGAGTLNYTGTGMRSGIGCGALNQILTANTKTFTPSGTGVVVGYARFNSNPSTNDFLQVRENTLVHLALSYDSSGNLVIKRGGTVMATTPSPVVIVSGWIYVELKALIDDAAGHYDVRIDGVSVLANAGIDTRNGGTGLWNNILVHGAGINPSTCLIDDMYVLDLSGPAPLNDFLGPISVETLSVQTDAVAAGSNAGLTPSTGTDHGALVDEQPPNTTDYNSSPTVGAVDTYNLTAKTFSGPILAIQTNLYVSKSDAAVRSVCGVVRTGGVDYDGANISPTTTFVTYSEPRPLNPNTGVAWTDADVNALQVGMKVTV